MLFRFDTAILLAAASGILLVALGVLLLSVRRRGANLAFGAFAILWGLQIVDANVARATTDRGLAETLFLVDLALVNVLYLFLVAFVWGEGGPEAPKRRPLAVFALALLPALATLVLFFAGPARLLGELHPYPGAPGTFYPDWSIYASLLVFAPSMGAFYYAVHAFAGRYRRATNPVARTRSALVLEALSLYTAYNTGSNVVYYALTRDPIFLPLFAVGTLVLAHAVLSLVRHRATQEPAQRGLTGWCILAIVAPFGVAIAEALVALLGAPVIETLGIWRTLTVAILVYGILRYQVFDIDLRLKRALPRAVGPVTFSLVLLVLVPFGGRVFPHPLLPGLTTGHVVASALALAVAVPAVAGGRRITDRLFRGVGSNPEYLYARKVEVYQTALEGILARGEPDDSTRDWLQGLRRHLGLTEHDHRILEMAARGHLRSRPLVGWAGPGATVAGAKYEILGTLGQGSFGTAHLARHSGLDRLVVLKELRRAWLGNAAAEKAFLDEARRAARLRHPNVVQVYDVETEGGAIFMVLEHAQSGTLEEAVAREGPFAIARAAPLLDDVLAGVGALHGSGLLHRDLSPSNVFLDEGGRAKVGDLGVALDLRSAGTEGEGGGTQPGTVAYMSPEQAAGRPVDARSDLYAAAALLHFMLSGRPPRSAEDLRAGDARQRIARGTAPEIDPRVPRDVRPILERGLAADPARRYPSADAMREALSPWVARAARP